MAESPLVAGMVQCPLCTVAVQRTVDGTLQDGVVAHYKTVHPSLPVPIVRSRRGAS